MSYLGAYVKEFILSHFWELSEQLVQLPRSPNVDGILKKYIDSQMKKHGR
jgi:hypothetical protein